MTGFGDPDGAELAIKKGAWDYLEKPLSVKEVTLVVERALLYREKKQAAAKPISLKTEGIVGSNPKLRACLDTLADWCRAHGIRHVLLAPGLAGDAPTGFSRHTSGFWHRVLAPAPKILG